MAALVMRWLPPDLKPAPDGGRGRGRGRSGVDEADGDFRLNLHVARYG